MVLLAIFNQNQAVLGFQCQIPSDHLQFPGLANPPPSSLAGTNWVYNLRLVLDCPFFGFQCIEESLSILSYVNVGVITYYIIEIYIGVEVHEEILGS